MMLIIFAMKQAATHHYHLTRTHNGVFYLFFSIYVMLYVFFKVFSQFGFIVQQPTYCTTRDDEGIMSCRLVEKKSQESYSKQVKLTLMFCRTIHAVAHELH